MLGYEKKIITYWPHARILLYKGDVGLGTENIITPWSRMLLYIEGSEVLALSRRLQRTIWMMDYFLFLVSGRKYAKTPLFLDFYS